MCILKAGPSVGPNPVTGKGIPYAVVKFLGTYNPSPVLKCLARALKMTLDVIIPKVRGIRAETKKI
jgi:hypothetical protein